MEKENNSEGENLSVAELDHTASTTDLLHCRYTSFRQSFALGVVIAD